MNQAEADAPEAANTEADDGEEEGSDTSPADGEEEGAAPDAADEAQGEPAAEAPEAAATAQETATAPPAVPQSQPGGNEVLVQGDDLARDAALYAQDQERGHIQPKTMKELYNGKDTTGKIGTLFGLLVAGMGSGLTGQSNVVMDMMQKEIDRDLEAQKASNASAQNWYRLNLDHKLQQAQLPEIRSRTEANKAQADKTRMGAEIDASAAAKNYMMLDQWGNLKEVYDKIPPGPLKDKYGAALEGMKTAIDAGIQKTSAEAAGKKKLIGAIGGEKPQAQAQGAARVDTRKLLTLKGLRDRAVQMGAPLTDRSGHPVGLDETQYTAAMTEANLVNKNRETYSVLKNAFEDLDKKPFGGKFNQNEFNAYKAHVAGQLSQGGLPQAEAEALVSSSLPDWKDWGSARDTKAQQLHELYKQKEAGTGTLDALPGMKPAFPPPPALSKSKGKAAGQATAPSKEEKPQESVSASGKPIIMKNGKWVYKK